MDHFYAASGNNIFFRFLSAKYTRKKGHLLAGNLVIKYNNWGSLCHKKKKRINSLFPVLAQSFGLEIVSKKQTWIGVIGEKNIAQWHGGLFWKNSAHFSRSFWELSKVKKVKKWPKIAKKGQKRYQKSSKRSRNGQKRSKFCLQKPPKNAKKWAKFLQKDPPCTMQWLIFTNLYQG